MDGNHDSEEKKSLLHNSGRDHPIVCAIILVLLLNLQAFKPQIETAASKAMGMEVRIKGRLGIVLFPGFGISLKNVSVQRKGADVVTVEKMRIGLRLIPLTKHEVRLSRVGLIKPVFSIVRYKNGRFNFEKPERSLIERLLTVNKISISEGRLVYTDESSSGRIKVDDFDGTIRDLSYGRTEGEGLFKNISFSGDIKCKTLTINNSHPDKPRDRNKRGKRDPRYKPGQYAHLRRDRERETFMWT